MTRFTQLVPPDLNTKGKVGLCLSFAEDTFHAPHQFPFAIDAWVATKFKHRDQNFPADVAVLLWWDYYLGPKQAGHVATRLPDGRIFSSPYQAGTTQAFLPSIAELERIYSNNGASPLKYLGWSEDIAGVRVVKEEDMPTIVDEGALKNILRVEMGRDITDADRAWLGRPWDEVWYGITGSPEYQTGGRLAVVAQRAENLQKQVDQLSAGATKLNPGTYIVS